MLFYDLVYGLVHQFGRNIAINLIIALFDFFRQNIIIFFLLCLTVLYYII